MKGFPELWGGIEGTINRVGDRYFDQCARSDHRTRGADFERFAELGIRALRCPILWELVAPSGLEHADWSYPDRCLTRLRELGIRPLAGLVHHGSGPRHTSLLDPAFAEGLARYARAVAERFPWLEDYTPVNEPLTTARFSALYGHWYPHHRDYPSFARALLNQCRGTILAMRAVREVNPRARLVQTEDMGRTYSTPRLAYQADFENEQRWLSYDLLFGRVTPQHPLHGHLLGNGVESEELEWFEEHALAPELVGLNYYVTSDRVLDERLELYPEWTHGGNGRDRYADVEAVRAWNGGITGHRALLEAAWERYGKPVAFTEVHLGCTREEQLRWVQEAWQGACDARAAGVDVRAITIWSLLGAFDWNSLVTQDRGYYEPGPFDLRKQPRPRRTALAKMMQSLAEVGRYEHAVLAGESGLGWWRRPERLLFGPQGAAAQSPASTRSPGEPEESQRARRGGVLIIGKSGTLGRAFGRVCTVRGVAHVLLGRNQVDITEPTSIAAALERYEPWAVINAAGYVRVDEAERDRERCFAENALGPRLLASACAAHGVRLLTFSSDLVFAGDRAHPYAESDRADPLNVYGWSKREAEKAVLQLMPSALVVRTSAFFGPWDEYNFVHLALSALARGERFKAATDAIVSPTYVPELVNASLDLLIDEERGLWHLANRGSISWADFARTAAQQADLDPALVVGAPLASLGLIARRPRFSALTSERGQLLSSLDDALLRFLHERPRARSQAEAHPRI